MVFRRYNASIPSFCLARYFGAREAISFWKRGSLRNGSNIGSSRSDPPRRVNSGTTGSLRAAKLLLQPGRLQRVSVIGVPDGVSDGEGVVATFFLIKYQTIVATRKEISLARQFSRVSLTNRREINFAFQFFGVSVFIIAVQQNFRDMVVKCSEANPNQLQSQIQSMRLTMSNPILARRQAVF